MFNRGLWYREWRNMRWMLLGVAVLFFLGITLGLVTDADRWQSQKDYYESSAFLKQQNEDPEYKTTDEEMKTSLTVVYLAMPMYSNFVEAEYNEYLPFMFYFQVEMFFTLIKIAVFILGVLAVIFERYTRGNRFTASLPYKRTHIIGVKMIMGIATIIFKLCGFRCDWLVLFSGARSKRIFSVRHIKILGGYCWWIIYLYSYFLSCHFNWITYWFANCCIGCGIWGDVNSECVKSYNG